MSEKAKQALQHWTDLRQAAEWEIEAMTDEMVACTTEMQAGIDYDWNSQVLRECRVSLEDAKFRESRYSRLLAGVS